MLNLWTHLFVLMKISCSFNQCCQMIFLENREILAETTRFFSKIPRSKGHFIVFLCHFPQNIQVLGFFFGKIYFKKSFVFTNKQVKHDSD